MVGILSMEFQVAGKKVEIDYLSQQRKETSRRLSNVLPYSLVLDV